MAFSDIKSSTDPELTLYSYQPFEKFKKLIFIIFRKKIVSIMDNSWAF